MMERERSYYQQLAEKFYTEHFAEIKVDKDRENAQIEKSWNEGKRRWIEAGNPDPDIDDDVPYDEVYMVPVCIDMKDESCCLWDNCVTLSPHQLLFRCSMEDGKVKVVFMKDGKDKITEMLGLVDLYDKNERIEVHLVRKEDRLLHLDLPEKLRRYDRDFYKIKLFGLDDFVSECNYTGWGDCFTNNVLEVIAGIMNQDCIDFDKNEIYGTLNCYVGPGEEPDTSYYAEFDFSHCELAKDKEDDDSGWAVFVCYEYRGLEEYNED